MDEKKLYFTSIGEPEFPEGCDEHFCEPEREVDSGEEFDGGQVFEEEEEDFYNLFEEDEDSEIQESPPKIEWID